MCTIGYKVLRGHMKITKKSLISVVAVAFVFTSMRAMEQSWPEVEVAELKRWPALMAAAYGVLGHGDADSVERLLDEGRDPNQFFAEQYVILPSFAVRRRHMTPLLIAATYGAEPRVFEALANCRRTRLSIRNERGLTALDIVQQRLHELRACMPDEKAAAWEWDQYWFKCQSMLSRYERAEQILRGALERKKRGVPPMLVTGLLFRRPSDQGLTPSSVGGTPSQRDVGLEPELVT